jgi:polyphosphate kinase
VKHDGAATKKRKGPGKHKADRAPGLFFNRELSWLAFNERVLEEAADPRNPLLERVKFASITASNLDEFFMVRVARLKHVIREEDTEPDISGMTPAAQLHAISERAHAMIAALYRLVMEQLLPALRVAGINVAQVSRLDSVQRTAVAAYLRDEVLPALTPLAIDASRPFPMLSSLSLNLAVRLAPSDDDDGPRLAVVQVPSRLPRLVRVAGGPGVTFVLLEDVIRLGFESLFPGQSVVESAAIRLARDSELELDDEGGQSYVETIQEELRQRRRNDVVRLEVEDRASDALVAWLAGQVDAAPDDIYPVPGPLDVRVFMSLADLPGFDELRDPSHKPVPALFPGEDERLFDLLDRRDVLLHHPYESFDPVVALVEQAADDPDVLAIKQTLYRTSGDSPIIGALMRAADQGKQVTVLVELTARFDEQRNIQWARALEEAGAHVIYGIRGFKVHAKICLVVRRTPQGIRRYLHLGTGNYNDRTARLYTDFGLLTSSPEFGGDASAFFNALTGFSDPPKMQKLIMAPTHLRERVLKLIDREVRRVQAGQPALIRAKMNTLVDERVCRALYAASAAGVRIMLNVRGACSLMPGVAGLSENISVVSIVGRFLEHPRIFHFHNGGEDEVYLASADWMPRNLDRRIELMFPIETRECRKKVLDALDILFRDNVKGRKLLPDGTWRVPELPPTEAPLEAQSVLSEQARREVERRESASAETFAPISSASPTTRRP